MSHETRVINIMKRYTQDELRSFLDRDEAPPIPLQRKQIREWLEEQAAAPAISARALLQGRLPSPTQALVVAELEIEKAPSACRLMPSSVKLWSSYEDKAINACIIEHQNQADNIIRR